MTWKYKAVDADTQKTIGTIFRQTRASGISMLNNRYVEAIRRSHIKTVQFIEYLDNEQQSMTEYTIEELNNVLTKKQ